MERRENNIPSWDGLGLRILSAIMLLGLGGVCIGMGGALFDMLVLLSALVMYKEWDNLTYRQMLALRLFGYPYIIIPCASLLWLRGLATPTQQELGLTLCMMLVCVIAATDIGAYFIGKRFGMHKLAPAISPNKTWEGFGGGLFFAVLTGCMFAPYIHLFNSAITIMFISGFISVISQVGDLFESWVKRLADAKDSGNLLPGHGGLLDRFDGYMFAAPVLACVIFLAMR